MSVAFCITVLCRFQIARIKARFRNAHTYSPLRKSSSSTDETYRLVFLRIFFCARFKNRRDRRVSHIWNLERCAFGGGLGCINSWKQIPLSEEVMWVCQLWVVFDAGVQKSRDAGCEIRRLDLRKSSECRNQVCTFSWATVGSSQLPAFSKYWVLFTTAEFVDLCSFVLTVVDAYFEVPFAQFASVSCKGGWVQFFCARLLKGETCI